MAILALLSGAAAVSSFTLGQTAGKKSEGTPITPQLGKVSDPATSGKTAAAPRARIKSADAKQVFLERSVPKYQAQTQQAFPGVDALPADAQGALFSLVYNRGTSMNGDSRKEMRAIRDAVPNGDLQEIANQLRAMKRLWVNKGLDGLLKRRDAEADLVESCIA